MGLENFVYVRITAAGTTTIDNSDGTPCLIYVYTTGVTLAGNYTLEFSQLPPVGTVIKVAFQLNSLDLNSNSCTLFGYSLNELQLANDGYYEFEVCDDHSGSPGIKYNYAPYDFTQPNIFDGGAINDATLTLAKFPAQTRGYIWAGDASGRPALLNAKTNLSWLIGDGTDLLSLAINGATSVVSAAISGGAIVFSYLAGSITNAAINASAAIAWSKMAALTASKVVVTTAGGVITTANQVSALLGGNGIDNSAATGFPIWTAGSQTVGAISEVITLMVSFEAAGGTQASVGDFKIKMPYAGTVTEIYAYATKAIAATDNGTIVPKNNAGTTMTSGTVTYTASDARGTAYTTTPSANNTFIAGDILTFTTAKATAGGIVQLSITVTRTS